MGRNDGRQWGDSTAAYGELSMAAVIAVQNPFGGLLGAGERMSHL
jgi:hypothetical protein